MIIVEKGYHKYSLEYITRKFKELANEIGRVPTKNDMKAKSKVDETFPSESAFRNYFPKHQDLIIACEIKPNKNQIRLKDEELIELLKKYNCEVGYPTTRGLKYNKNYPSDEVYRKRFGSFKNALELAGIDIPKSKTKLHSRASVTDETLLSNLKSYINTLGEYDFLPIGVELDDIPNVPTRNVLLRRFGTIGNLYTLLGYDYLKYNDNILKNKMKKEYIKLYHKLNRTPEYRDLDKYSKMGVCNSASAYANNFGTLTNLQTELKLPISNSIGNLKSRKELLFDLKKLGEELKRLPTQRDLHNCDWIASVGKYSSEFGCFTEALKLAGFDDKWFNDRVKMTKNGNATLSSYEFDFTNMLEDYNIKFVQEEFYKKYIKDLKKNYQFDFTLFIDGNIYFVEVFCMMDRDSYAEKAQTKIDLCKENNLKLLEFYRKDFKKSDGESLYNLLTEKINSEENLKGMLSFMDK